MYRNLSLKKLVFLSCTTIFLLFLTLVESLEFYSQIGQDRYLYETLFHDKKNGVFIDIGAHDGITYNNTYFFEKNLGWTGICIEPLPEIFAKLQKSRKAKCIQGCVAETNGFVDFLKITSNGTESTEMLSGIYENYDPRHLARIKKEIKLFGGSYEHITVPSFKLNDILTANKIYDIDYLSIDIEGGELNVLKSIDYDTFNIDVIDVENNYNDPEIRSFLESKGFIYIETLNGQDELYVR